MTEPHQNRQEWRVSVGDSNFNSSFGYLKFKFLDNIIFSCFLKLSNFCGKSPDFNQMKTFCISQGSVVIFFHRCKNIQIKIKTFENVKRDKNKKTVCKGNKKRYFFLV